jgi:hypothetical protein
MWRAHVPDAARVPEEGLRIIRPRFPLTVQNKATVTLAVVLCILPPGILYFGETYAFFGPLYVSYSLSSDFAYLSFFVLYLPHDLCMNSRPGTLSFITGLSLVSQSNHFPCRNLAMGRTDKIVVMYELQLLVESYLE